MDRVSDFFRKLKRTIRGWGILQWAAFGVSIVCVVIMAALVIQLFQMKNNYETVYPQNAATIASLQSELAIYQNPDDDVDPDTLEKVAKSAYAQGSRVAALQNAFWDCYTNSKLSGTSVEDAYRENIMSLSKFFDESTGAGLDCWFQPDLTITNVSKRIAWTFVSDLRSTDDQFDVLWLCKDTQGALVAYATGVFDAETELFSDITYNTTTYGHTNYQSEVESYDKDPADDGTYIPVDNVDIPAGYTTVINPDGSVSIVDADGNAYDPEAVGDPATEVWSGEFKNDFGEDFQDAINKRVEAMTQQNGQ